MADQRTAILDALGAATGPAARAAIVQGDAWMTAHPDDGEVQGALEGALMLSEAWDAMTPEERTSLEADLAARRS